jgi:photosystem II stability/assembly factor-like uncharacterized protein
MKQVGIRSWLKLTVSVIGVVALTTPIHFFAAGIEPEPLKAPNWLSAQIGGSVGPPGGEVRALAMSPMDPDRLYAGTASGHIFVTEDGAKHWRDCQVRLPREAVLWRLAVNPHSPGIAFAAYWLPSGGGGVLRSRDGGNKWESLALPGDPAVRALAISPSAPETVYAGGPAGVWRSEDGGDTWTEAVGRAKPIREVESLAVDPRSPLRVYAGTWRQAYRSLDGGRIWAPIATGMDLDRDVFTIALSPHDPDKLFAGTCGFLYKSDNGGDVWANRMAGITMDRRRIHTIWADPINAREVWVGTRGGIFRSLDDANSFTLLRDGVSVSSILTDPKGSRVFAATEEFGILTGGRDTSFVESNLGLEASRVPAFDSPSGDLGVLFAARTERPGAQSVWMSSDAGQTWHGMGRGTQFNEVRFLRGLAGSEPQALVIGADGRWWRLRQDGRAEPLAAPPGKLSAVEVVRDPEVVLAATDRGLYFAPADSLAAAGAQPATTRNREGGKVSEKAAPSGWRQAYSGALMALGIQGDGFIALGPERVVRGGATALLEGKPPEEMRPEGLPQGVVAVALPLGKDSQVVAITQSKVLASADRGQTWTEVQLPWPASDLCALVVDPGRPGTVVALDSHGAVLEGIDRQPRWRVLLGKDPWLSLATDIRMSATVPGLALISTLGHGIRVVSLEPPAAPLLVKAASTVSPTLVPN